MAAGVEVVEIAGQVLEALDVVGHRLVRKAPQIFLSGTGIHRVGGMRDKRDDTLIFLVLQEGFDICEVELFRPAAARIAREKGKRVRIEPRRLAPHGEKALGRGQVAADVQFIFHRHVILQSVIKNCYLL